MFELYQEFGFSFMPLPEFFLRLLPVKNLLRLEWGKKYNGCKIVVHLAGIDC
jgi:hypothetical protein